MYAELFLFIIPIALAAIGALVLRLYFFTKWLFKGYNRIKNTQFDYSKHLF